MWKAVLVASLMLTSAGAAAGVQEWRLDHALDLMARGFAPRYDVDGNFHWQGGVVDAAVASATQRTAMDEDSASAFDDLARHPPKRKPVTTARR